MMANYSATSKNDLPTPENGAVFESSNFLQLEAHTSIFSGVTGLRFVNCNLTNCDLPADAEVTGTKVKHRSFCSNLHPNWVAKGLTECGENCSHVVDTDTVTIDSVVVDTIYHYEDTVVS